jgi:hypothetical protein
VPTLDCPAALLFQVRHRRRRDPCANNASVMSSTRRTEIPA